MELLLAHGANIEHRDKKGCTPLILAASAGHAVTVAILLDHNADIEAQSDRTKDTALSLACSGGRQEVRMGTMVGLSLDPPSRDINVLSCVQQTLLIVVAYSDGRVGRGKENSLWH